MSQVVNEIEPSLAELANLKAKAESDLKISTYVEKFMNDNMGLVAPACVIHGPFAAGRLYNR